MRESLKKKIALVKCSDELRPQIREWLVQMPEQTDTVFASSFLEIKDKVVFDDIILVLSELDEQHDKSIEFLRSVMSVNPLIQRIAILNDLDFPSLSRAVNRAHIDYVVTKPLDKKHFQHLVHKALRRYEIVSKPFRKFEVLSEVTEDLLQQNERFRQEASSDPLTKLLNRRSFDSFCMRFWERWQRSQVTFCLALIDLDHFKSINDTYGHICGDEVLRSVAQMLQKNQRSGIDFAFRYGGEEFAILSITTEPDEMHNYIKRLVRELRESVIKTGDGKQVRVTMSAGISTVYTSDSLEELIAKADEALYQAKEAGRDRAILNYDLF